MSDQASHASGNWHVEDGKEEEFLARWREFLQWTRENVDGFGEAVLLRDLQDSSHFVSMARWEDPAAQQRWREEPGFAERFGACRELCSDFKGGPFSEAVRV